MSLSLIDSFVYFLTNYWIYNNNVIRWEANILNNPKEQIRESAIYKQFLTWDNFQKDNNFLHNNVCHFPLDFNRPLCDHEFGQVVQVPVLFTFRQKRLRCGSALPHGNLYRKGYGRSRLLYVRGWQFLSKSSQVYPVQIQWTAGGQQHPTLREQSLLALWNKRVDASECELVRPALGPESHRESLWGNRYILQYVQQRHSSMTHLPCTRPSHHQPEYP